MKRADLRTMTITALLAALLLFLVSGFEEFLGAGAAGGALVSEAVADEPHADAAVGAAAGATAYSIDAEDDDDA